MNQNQILRISIASIFCYLICNKSYEVISSVLLWIFVKFKIESDWIIFGSNILLIIISFFILMYAYNRVFKNKIPNYKNIWTVIAITVGLHFIIIANNHYFSIYIVESSLGSYREKYLLEYGWSKAFENIFPLIVLIVFIQKMYSDKTVVDNSKKEI